MPVNLKSDVDTKHAFVALLRRRGFDTAAVAGSPADITATRAGRTYYFEIKFTSKTTHYIGAATLTEWKAAMANDGTYFFVVASRNGTAWRFQEYSPSEFMQFSCIPPFKVYFQVPVSARTPIAPRPGLRRIKLTRSRIDSVVALFKRFRSGGARDWPHRTSAVSCHSALSFRLQLQFDAA